MYRLDTIDLHLSAFAADIQTDQSVLFLTWPIGTNCWSRYYRLTVPPHCGRWSIAVCFLLRPR